VSENGVWVFCVLKLQSILCSLFVCENGVWVFFLLLIFNATLSSCFMCGNGVWVFLVQASTHFVLSCLGFLRTIPLTHFVSSYLLENGVWFLSLFLIFNPFCVHLMCERMEIDFFICS